MPNIIFESSGWWLPLVAAGSLLACWLLYFKGKQFSRGQRLFLAGLRFFIFFFLGILLLSPLLKSNLRVEEKPILLWLEDHSQSVLQGDDSNAVAGFFAQEIPAELRERYQLEHYSFAARLSADNDSLDQFATDIATAIGELRERFYNQNVGAMVLSTDGIYNQGQEPGYSVRDLPFPVYTVGLGDTSLRRDVFIERITHNRISYRGNQFPVEVFLRARRVEGEPLQLKVYNRQGQLVFSKELRPDRADYFERVDFFLTAGEKGLQSYTAELSVLPDELSTNNNRRTFTLEVIDNRKRIAIVGRGPHPDMAALKNALDAVEKYEVKSYIARALPTDLEKSDLLILHDPDPALLEDLSLNTTPLWVIVGESTQGEMLDKRLGIRMPTEGLEEVTALPEGAFTAFKLSPALESWLRELPPLAAPFGRIESREALETFLYKKIGSVETTNPLWVFSSGITGNKDRRSITLGTGLWRWRMANYRREGNFEFFDELVSKVVQYLTTSRQEQRFQVDLPSNISTAEPLLAEARLYNPSMELVVDPEVSISFSDEKGTDYNFSFSRSRQVYKLGAGKLPAGNYRWQATTSLGDENFERRGNLVVGADNVEMQDLVARHDLLRRMSRQSGGKYFPLSSHAQLWDSLQNEPQAQSIQRLESHTASFIEERWLFAIFLVLLALEWALRKYFGNY